MIDPIRHKIISTKILEADDLRKKLHEKYFYDLTTRQWLNQLTKRIYQIGDELCHDQHA